MDPSDYCSVSGENRSRKIGGQELLMNEILAIFLELAPGSFIWLPFQDQWELGRRLRGLGFSTGKKIRKYVDALYLGTPTIVDNKSLFPEEVDDREWSKEVERIIVAEICKQARDCGCKLIITGLGEGDIDTDERLENMGGGEVVVMKKFTEFTDWLLRWRSGDDDVSEQRESSGGNVERRDRLDGGSDTTLEFGL